MGKGRGGVRRKAVEGSPASRGCFYLSKAAAGGLDNGLLYTLLNPDQIRPGDPSLTSPLAEDKDTPQWEAEFLSCHGGPLLGLGGIHSSNSYLKLKTQAAPQATRNSMQHYFSRSRVKRRSNCS